MAKVEIKQPIVDEIAGYLADAQAMVLVDYRGLTVEEDTQLRKALREAGVDYKVYKNTLIKRAVKGTVFEAVTDLCEGPTAIATSETDYAGAARILSKYAKSHEGFAIKSGFLDGEVIDMDKIDALSKLPTREVLLANVLGAFQAPIASFARGVQAIVDKGGVEACLADKENAEAPAEEAEAPAEETAE